MSAVSCPVFLCQAQGTWSCGGMSKVHHLEWSEKGLQLHRALASYFHWHQHLCERIVSQRAREIKVHLPANPKPRYGRSRSLSAFMWQAQVDFCSMIFRHFNLMSQSIICICLCVLQWSLKQQRRCTFKQFQTCSWNCTGMVLLAGFLHAV